MSYRYDNKKKFQGRMYGIATILIIIFFVTPLPRFIINTFEAPLERAWVNAQENGTEVSGFAQRWFQSNTLLEVNQELREKNEKLQSALLRAQYLESVLDSYRHLEATSGDVLLARVLVKPPYGDSDTLILNQGEDDGVLPGMIVFSDMLVELGVVTDVFDTSSRAQLFTHNEQEIQGIIYPHNQSVVLKGYGGSYFSEVERSIEVEEGDVVYSQRNPGRILAVVQRVIFDPRDPFKQVYLSLPHHLREVQSVGLVSPQLFIPLVTEEEPIEE